ncbi:hypothetical protein Scep_001504 [Stephania cephalantha]|uniref:Uncharacterized protein n=1 Tax=Stephania cephalantha TaxID=152367 RepID=A0AAP0Q410_9MAGN
MMSAHTIDNTGPPINDHGDGKDPVDPLAIGAGHINPNKAMNTCLIYDASVDDYVRFLWSMNFTSKQITTTTRSSHFNCSNPSLVPMVEATEGHEPHEAVEEAEASEIVKVGMVPDPQQMKKIKKKTRLLLYPGVSMVVSSRWQPTGPTCRPHPTHYVDRLDENAIMNFSGHPNGLGHRASSKQGREELDHVTLEMGEGAFQKDVDKDASTKTLGPERDGRVRGFGCGVTSTTLRIIEQRRTYTTQLEKKIEQLDNQMNELRQMKITNNNSRSTIKERISRRTPIKSD